MVLRIQFVNCALEQASTYHQLVDNVFPAWIIVINVQMINYAKPAHRDMVNMKENVSTVP